MKAACFFFSFFTPCAARELVGEDMEVDDTSEKKELETTYVFGQDPGAPSAKRMALHFGTPAPIGKGISHFASNGTLRWEVGVA